MLLYQAQEVLLGSLHGPYCVKEAVEGTALVLELEDGTALVLELEDWTAGLKGPLPVVPELELELESEPLLTASLC